MAIAITLLLTVAVAGYVVLPLWSDEHRVQPSTETLGPLLEQKSRCVQVLKDLELDFSTGKIAHADYDRMKQSLHLELGELLTRIDGSRPA